MRAFADEENYVIFLEPELYPWLRESDNVQQMTAELIADGYREVELDKEGYVRTVVPASDEVKATVDEIKSFIVSQRTVKDWYSVAEIAAAVNRSPYQVRKWCRDGRIEARKIEGVGPDGNEPWEIPHSALEYYRNHQLLPRKH